MLALHVRMWSHSSEQMHLSSPSESGWIHMLQTIITSLYNYEWVYGTRGYIIQTNQNILKTFKGNQCNGDTEKKKREVSRTDHSDLHTPQYIPRHVCLCLVRKPVKFSYIKLSLLQQVSHSNLFSSLSMHGKDLRLPMKQKMFLHPGFRASPSKCAGLWCSVSRTLSYSKV